MSDQNKTTSVASQIREIEKRLESIDIERHQLIRELSALRLSANQNELPDLLGAPVASRVPETPDEKIELFLKLFRARESVYPKLWENAAKGTKGYSPACSNEWVRTLCDKPRIKCSECPNQAFPKLDASAVRDHLQGKQTIGTYAIREDDSCIFLAADFDGTGWSQDVLAYCAAARELSIQVEVERSRSGNGAHAWIFFSEPIASRVARQMGTVIVARAQASRLAIGLDTYDRFFPNQDFLPKGGFGNLIALPLQKNARDEGNSVFLKQDLTPYIDQWEHLASVRRLTPNEVHTVLNRQLADSSFSSIRFEDENVAWAEKALDSGNHKVVAGSFPGQIEIELGSQLSIKIDGLPSAIFSALKRTATFANPVFFEKQRMRFSTWQTPRFIFCGEVLQDQLILPRGSLDVCLEIAKKACSSVVIKDARATSPKIKAQFIGELSAEQAKAVNVLNRTEIGVLVAPPGAGKTVMACALIAKRKTSTLILVHRTQLMDQWKLRLSEFLGLNPKDIGSFGGTRKKQSGQVDVGMLPTFAKLENAADALAAYGQIIIDECHHVPAVSFEEVLKKCPTRFILGLTATPYRKDGHQSIIHMQCGPVRYEMKEVDGPKLDKRVVVRETAFKMPDGFGPQPAIHLVWEHLVQDRARLELVAQDLKTSLESGRFPLVISERKEHLAQLEQVFVAVLSGSGAQSFILIGGMGKKERAKTLADIHALRKAGGSPYILATGSFIGEGFDFPELDTLMIAMPVSFKGKLIQYAGRLHRSSPEKTDTIIYDYLDTSSALTTSMFRKRLAAYKKMEYRIDAPAGTRAGRMSQMQSGLF